MQRELNGSRGPRTEALGNHFAAASWGGIDRDPQHSRGTSYPPLGVAAPAPASYEGYKGSHRVRGKANPLLVGISMLASGYLIPAIHPSGLLSFDQSSLGPVKWMALAMSALNGAPGSPRVKKRQGSTWPLW